MKIETLRVQGFKSLHGVTWKPGDLNVLIGPNAGGKSNLLSVFDLLGASARGDLEKWILAQGGLLGLLWNDESRELSIELELPDARLPNLEVRYRLTIEQASSIFDFNVRDQIVGLFDSVDTRPSQSHESSHETHLSTLRAQDTHADHQKYLAGFAANYAIDTSLGSTLRQPPITSWDLGAVDPLGENLTAVLHTLYTTKPEFEEDIDRSMRIAFGPEYEKLHFTPAGEQRIQLRIRWKSLSRSRPDLSDGAWRFLYVLTILAHPNPPPLIAIDEPETGLHPSMMPIIAELAADAALRSQVVLTTHSPEFLDAFRETATPTVTVVENHEGKTQLQTLDQEELDYWLRAYSLGKLFRTGKLENMAEDIRLEANG
ncbi:MAG: AAA family ATPase [Acidobacteriota bacterium]